MSAGENDRARVASVLALVLGVDVPGAGDLARKDVAQWDSVKHVELVFALEDEFEVRISEALIPRLDSLAAIVTAVGELR